MTEEEAVKKWCPMSRVAVPVGQTVNRIAKQLLEIVDDEERKYFENQQDNCLCLASACGCWCWEGKNSSGEFEGRCGLSMPHTIYR